MPPKGRPKSSKPTVKTKTDSYVFVEEQQSPHRRNLRIVGYPVLLVFSLVRFLLFQFWVTLAPYVCKTNFVGTVSATSKPNLASITDSENFMAERSEDNSKSGQNDPSLVRQRYHHKKAFEHISEALKIDESKSGNKKQALELYRKGVKELEQGIGVDCSKDGPEWERARRLQEKMKNNMTMAKERIEILKSMRAYETCAAVEDETSTALPKKQNSSNSAAKLTQTSGSSADNKTSKPSSCDSKGSTTKPQVPKLTSKTHSLPREVSDASDKKSHTPPSQRKKPQARTNSGFTGINRGRGGSLKKGGTSSNPADVAVKEKINRMKNIETELAHRILDEIVDSGTPVKFSDVAGQDAAKQALQEIVILPALRPELFTGLRAPARGLLLFGPPGNGKTMLAKAIAHEANATFFSISASTLMSKFLGEGEKLVRALFAVAKELQPSVIFIDEVDSLLTERREGEHDASRRMKTEFLVQFDGVTADSNDRVLVMGATNRPQELDDAVLRRFVKRVYVAMPDLETRKQLLSQLLSKHKNPLSESELYRLAQVTEGYSGSDLTALAKDAALGPIRDLGPTKVKSTAANEVRSIQLKDFHDALKRIRRSVNSDSLALYQRWNAQYGDVASI
ncbi:Spastin [Holothuria leucospilota]|uniref:Spastin n=1 Tax=Holothuria leucospilota TaxID=206669 RepID=A0A9Q1CGR8_HOLLE|nr:Spastin [Holothuria leucospilota]